VPNTNTTAAKSAEREAIMVTTSFRSFDGSTIFVLENGTAVRDGITGRMLLVSVGGEFVRYLADDEIPEARR
jgi:hypothetical protein